MVKKKTGKWKLCVDFRQINAKSVKDAYPMGGTVRDKRKRPTTKNRQLGEESCLRPCVPCPTKQDLA